MVESLRRVREPAAVVALLVAVIQAALAVVYWLDSGDFSGVFIGDKEALLAAVLVLSCAGVEPRSRNAGALAIVAVVMFTAGAVVQVTMTFHDTLASQPMRMSTMIKGLAGSTPIALLAFLVLMVVRPPRPAPALSVAEPDYGETVVVPAPNAQADPVCADPGLEPRQPVWDASAATGAVWRRASDAASGAAATAYGAASEGWQGERPAIAQPSNGSLEPGSGPSGPAPWDPADDVTRPR